MNQELTLTVERVMACPPEKRAQAIIETDNPAEIVQALSAQEAYLVIKDAWEGDGRLLLPYVPAEKLPAFLDLDCWAAEGLNLENLLEWLWALADISLEHLASAVAELDLEITVMLFDHHLTVETVSPVDDNVPDLLAAGFETIDDVFFFRFHDEVPENELLKRLLKELYASNPQLYRTIMYSAGGESQAGLEEEAFQQRRLRLTELGFVPAEEALFVYRRQKPTRILAAELDERLVPRCDSGPWRLPAVYRPAELSLLGQTLVAVDAAQRERLGFELVYLVNKLIMADFKPLNSSEELGAAVAKAVGLTGIGLAEAARIKGLEPAAVLAGLNVEQLFSLGYNLILEEQQRCKQLGLDRELLPEAERELVEGLLRKRPRFGTRDFAGPDDLDSLRAALGRLEALKRLTADLAWQACDFKATNLGGSEGLDLENLALTMLALNALGAGDGFRPLTPAEFRRFAELIIADGQIKAGFAVDLTALIEARGVDRDVARALAARLSERLASELGGLDLTQAEPRFVTAVAIAG
ncbi:MAG: hypothetical protein BWY87_01185 [Deltaproteobacteria bacterium ADurb.Bin510]|nr:MAG: hypothetical protein BWY87_01185 [Deltaproteobacteria bacterium ADurb.Bin510]